MLKRYFAAALALACLAGSALAEVYAGVTVAAATATVAAESGGTVESVRVQPGATVAEGEALATLRTRKVFAAEDGTVARILVRAGARADGAVLELSPVSRYTIHCTVDGAYQTAASTRVRSGEALYLRCTADGTHRGTGRITQIDGEEYLVEATGGELYVGETVNLYRDADFTAAQRVGVGTVVAADPRSYEAEGEIVRMHVTVGEYVERGELLFEIAEGKETTLAAPAAGIVTSVPNPGDALQPGQAAFSIVAPEQIQVAFTVDEASAARLSIGDIVELIYADDPAESVHTGTVTFLSRLPEDGNYAVRVAPETPPARLGLTTYVRTAESDDGDS